MTVTQVVRGPLLNPRPDGSVEFLSDAGLAGDEHGRIAHVGPWSEVAAKLGPLASLARAADGWLMPPMLDAHIHVPQFPIRGGFLAGIEGSPTGGPLLAGLNRNVFPAEGKCHDPDYAAAVVEQFRLDTLAHGVVGGAAYMTVHTPATRIALERLGDFWSVGLVMMEQNCPEYLRNDDANFDADMTSLAEQFGRRAIVTDRFAGAVDTPLRRRGVAIAKRFGLRTQTHLNEQVAEKAWIEDMYPDATSYTDVYRRDGLLDCDPLLAHCIQMRPDEWAMLEAAKGSVVAHCPVSNTLLGSGIMPLDEVVRRRIPYAICTDVGASPTTSLLTEMTQYLKVHAGRSAHATPQEAVYRTTLAPAEILGVGDRIGSFDVGKDFSFVEVTPGISVDHVKTIEHAILDGLLEFSAAQRARYEPGDEMGRHLDRLQAGGLPVSDELSLLTADTQATASRLDAKIRRVTLAGQIAWSR